MATEPETRTETEHDYVDTMGVKVEHREMEPGVHWINEHGAHKRLTDLYRNDPGTLYNSGESPEWFEDDQTIQISVNAFLFIGEDETLLFDSLSPLGTESLVEILDELLDGRDLDYIALSHPDVPHAGGALRLIDSYPDATLIAPDKGDDHELYYLGDARKVAPGESIDLGGHVITFREAKFVDAPMSMWITEETKDILITVDWLGYHHTEEECMLFDDELDAELDHERFSLYSSSAEFWYRYADADKVKAEIDYIINEYDPAMVCPAHGMVLRDNPAKYLEREKGSLEYVKEEGKLSGGLFA